MRWNKNRRRRKKRRVKQTSGVSYRMSALRVHDPRRGDAASPFDGQVSPLALQSFALHRVCTQHTHKLTLTLSPLAALELG